MEREELRMEDKLSEEEVKHVARLARISVSDPKTLEKYQYQLKKLLDEIDKIKEVKDYDDEFLIAPVDHDAKATEDEASGMISFQDMKKNAPQTKGNFVEVPVMIRE